MTFTRFALLVPFFAALASPFTAAEEVSYQFTFEIDQARYLGQDSAIDALVPIAGETITGIVSYDTSAPAGTTTGDITPYAQTGFNAGMFVPQSNGIQWEADAGSLTVRVFDRASGNDVVSFEGGAGSTINIPGLTVDYMWLRLFYASSQIGGIGLQEDYDFPTPIPGHEIDLRATDSNNSEYRIFGKLQSLERVTTEVAECGSIELPSEPEFQESNIYQCADFNKAGRVDAKSQADLDAYMSGGYGNVGDGILKNLRVRFTPENDVEIISPCSVRVQGEKNVPLQLDNLTVLAGGAAQVRPRSGEMTVSNKLTIVSRDQTALLTAKSAVSVGELCLQGSSAKIKSLGLTSAESATLVSSDNELQGIQNLSLDGSVLTLRPKSVKDEQEDNTASQ